MDLAPGDKVVCVSNRPRKAGDVLASKYLVLGRVYEVAACLQEPNGRPVLQLVGFDHAALDAEARARGGSPPAFHLGFLASRFRKRPDIGEWLATETDFEEPKRAPAPRETA